MTVDIAGDADYTSLNPFRAPEPLPILDPSNFVPKNGFPVVKGLSLEFSYAGCC